MKNIVKRISVVVASMMIVTLFASISYANPSTYWCGTHKRTGCTHCLSHTMINAGYNTATCTNGGGQVKVCTASGCGCTFFQNKPLGHSYTNKVCTRTVTCGKIDTSDSSHFEYYMYRTGNHARYISCGWLGYTNHRAIDITNGSGTSISGFPIYAQGPGTAVVVGGSTNSTAGYYVVIAYDNGYVARYLHVQENGRVAQNSRVTSQTRIAYTSNTGDYNGSSYGYHLHYDVIHSDNVNVYYSNLGMSNTNNINPTTLFPSGTFN